MNEEKNESKKKARKISEETLQMLTSVLITTISTAAVVISIATGAKVKRRK